MRWAFETTYRLLVAECKVRRYMIFSLFVIINIVMVTIGLVWPRLYASFTVIHVEQANSFQHLMHKDSQASIVDGVQSIEAMLNNERVMAALLESSGRLGTRSSLTERDNIKENIHSSISVTNVGTNLIKVEYRDIDPVNAHVTAKLLGDLIVSEGDPARAKDAQGNYAFIDDQVQGYLLKVTALEEELERFRSENPNARPGMGVDILNHISILKDDVNKINLQIKRMQVKRDSINMRLLNNDSMSISQSKEGSYRAMISEMKTQLETLRLDYSETNPEIINLKKRIEELARGMNDEIKKRHELQKTSKLSTSGEGDNMENNVSSNLLRNELSDAEYLLAELNSRLYETNKTIEKEYYSAKKTSGSEEVLTKLTRDYQVTQDIYQDLLRRREITVASGGNDKLHQGVIYKIQEYAALPLEPSGLRFMHFMVFGLFFGIVFPVFMVYVSLKLSPRGNALTR